ncbi:MAG: hypothetical protein GVY13_14055 [Alphaproteobacteria bacterium]|jgi:hypothetical protein|nr:hypothetical protein [Alphaproteobacteria bacterium]
MPLTETAAPATDLVDTLIARGGIGEDDVLALRRSVFRDGIVDANEAEMVFALERQCRDKAPGWTTFYCEALTDYIVRRREPRGYVDEATADMLMQRIIEDGRIHGPTELALLVSIVDRAETVPPGLRVFVLEAVHDSVLRGGDPVYGKDRQPGVIVPVDVEIVRKVVYAAASPGGFTITEREADLLFALNDATVDADNAPAWQDLFVKGVANYLMFPRGAPVIPAAETVQRRAAKAAAGADTRGFLARFARAFGGGDFGFGEAWRALDPFGREAEREMEQREAARKAEADMREAIDQREAQWLGQRIAADGVLHENERALLVFIRRNATAIHPDLEPVMARFGV